MDIPNLLANIVSILVAGFAIYKWLAEKKLRKKQESKIDLEIIKDYQEILERVSDQLNESSAEIAILREEVSTLKIEKNSCKNQIEHLQRENKELKLILIEKGLIEKGLI